VDPAGCEMPIKTQTLKPISGPSPKNGHFYQISDKKKVAETVFLRILALRGKDRKERMQCRTEMIQVVKQVVICI
jgi:hypothetical protein